MDTRGVVPLGRDLLVQLEMQLYYCSAGRYNSQFKPQKTDNTYMIIPLLTCFNVQILLSGMLRAIGVYCVLQAVASISFINFLN